MHDQRTGEDHGWKRSALLAGFGCIALFIAVLVYVADRDASRAVLMPSLAVPAGRHLFGSPGQWLPSLFHTLAFSLLTAATLKPATAARLGACAFWGTVNVAFEVGQHTAFKPRWAEALHGGAGDSAIGRWVVNYELHGTFDPRDICAAVIGALAAVLLTQLADRVQETPHAQA